MATPLLLLVLPVAICAAGSSAELSGPAVAAPSWVAMAPDQRADALRDVYQQAESWAAFHDRVDRRRSLWLENWARAEVPEALAARARAVGGSWRVLVITEAGCSDSVNSVPYIARLVEATPSLELRLVDATVGRRWLEAHRSPDGRAATPTVLVLDEAYRIRGCWIEQPAALQAWWLPVVARGTMTAEVGEKMAWYVRDRGRETLREFVEVLEAAGTERVVCPGLN
jgi:hypothetical protein